MEARAGLRWTGGRIRGEGAEVPHPSRNPALDFPDGAVVKNSPANAGDMGSSPGPGKSHMLRSN